MKKCVITVVGKDTVGIIARVCTYLAEAEINILDISQTIVDGYFNMMMIVDVANTSKEIADVAKELEELGLSIGVSIHCQREEIFEKMHRL
jgi:ACT domain-containing protein